MEDKEKNKGAVDRINDLYGAYQNAKFLKQLGGRGAGALGRAGLAATSEVWGPIAIAIGLIVFFVVIIMVISGGQATGTETLKNESSQQQTPVPVVCTTIDQSPRACLKKDFNIEADGFSNKELKDIYNAFSLTYSYPLYKNAWDKGNRKLIVTIEPPFHAETVGTCTGEALPGHGGNDKLKLWNPGGKCTFYGGMAYLIIHEAAHILSDRDESLLDKFSSEYNGLIRSDGDECYKLYAPLGGTEKYYLKTYIGPGKEDNEENFAEGVADYVLYKTWAPAQGGKIYSLEDFPNQCRKTHSWLRENVFGQ